MGMITTNVLEESLSFGPLPTSLMIGEPAYLIAQTTTDRLSELPTIYADPKRLSDPIRLIEWVCNLRCARCPGEQNMELICSNRLGQSFYRTTRRIEAGEELLIWFRRQDLQPLLSEHLNNVHISEAWFGQTVKSANSHHKDYEELENGYSKPFSVDHNKFKCPQCSSEFTYIYPYISHCLFKCQKLCVMPNIQLINQPPISNEYSNEMTNKFSHQQNTDYSLVTNTKDEGRSNRMENILLKNDPSPLILESLPTEVISSSFCSSSVTDMKYNKREEFQCKINDFDQIYDPSNKTMISFHKKYLHKIRSNNKMLLNFKTKQNTPNNHIDDSQGIYRKSKLKNNVLPLKTRNPLVEQLIQTLIVSKIDSTLNSSNVDMTTTSPTLMLAKKQQSSLLNSLSLAQNWCARCYITFRLTSDLVHHMRTYHNQSSKTSNNKERTTLNTTHIHSKDKSQKNKELYTDEVNSRKEITNLYSSEQSCLSRALSQIQLQSQSSLTTPLMSTISSCSTNQLICSLCSEQFKEKHHLTRHMLSHT